MFLVGLALSCGKFFEALEVVSRNESARDSRRGRGPSGKTFNFTFHRRGTDEQLDELGRLMTNVCKLIPGGVVCFLASYGYLDQVCHYLFCCTPCASNHSVVRVNEDRHPKTY